METDTGARALGACLSITRILLAKEARVRLYDEARRHFSEKELVDLTAAVIAINAWNRAAIAFRMTPRSTSVKIAA
jgi:alkylhydroperoxidase family enzyme